MDHTLLLALFLCSVFCLASRSSHDGYPRPSESGERLLQWLLDHGGIAHATVVEIGPGHRKLMTNRDLAQGVDVLYVPSELSLHPASPHVVTNKFIRDAQSCCPQQVTEEWIMQTFLMLQASSTASATTGRGTSLFDPYFDSLPTLEDYQRHCHWSQQEIEELQMQPYEPGMPQPQPNRIPEPSAWSPAFLWDNDYEWNKWTTITQQVLDKFKWNSTPAAQAFLKQRWNILPATSNETVFFDDRLRFAWANLVLSSREWVGHQLWPVLDMADSNLLEQAAFSVNTNPQTGGRVQTFVALSQGTEVFTVPQSTTNLAFLQRSCHAFPNNPSEFVMLDIQLPTTLAENPHWIPLLQSIVTDTRPYEHPHSMDHMTPRNGRVTIYQSQSQQQPHDSHLQQQPTTLRATIRLFRNSVTALLSVARAVVWLQDDKQKNTRLLWQASSLGRQRAVHLQMERQALELADQWLRRRRQQFPTSLSYDQDLLANMIHEAEPKQHMSLEKLRVALIFRTQQKDIIEANWKSVRSMTRTLYMEYNDDYGRRTQDEF
ncbi:expressed unknown protein [Seminavis robusta]|uniref:Rubisco LSMT substrate-binding domain-containing protein n=1 Tax=Seminavis robusta TaxID=568900 RepID=A0A9N8DSF9_9STRA|nr:expressed unknown protein [Seminavis robusta]|eukprot:Sro218_g090090.1 n/a (545) ;mRNA; f:40504-42138